MPVKLFFIDEGAGTQALLSEPSSCTGRKGRCDFCVHLERQLPGRPLFRDLKILNYMWDCGTQRVLEESKFRYVYRLKSYGTAEMLSSVLYLLRKTRPKPHRGQSGYAWGRDSWQLFSTLMTPSRT